MREEGPLGAKAVDQLAPELRRFEFGRIFNAVPGHKANFSRLQPGFSGGLFKFLAARRVAQGREHDAPPIFPVSAANRHPHRVVITGRQRKILIITGVKIQDRKSVV